MTRLIPQIGTTGPFLLSDPLTDLFPATLVLECVSIRKLGEIVASGRDPYTTFYEPYNLSRDVYAEHAAAGECIIGLRSEAGRVFQIPSPFIRSFPIPGGVAYENYALAVSLGALPQDLPLDHVEQAVRDLIADMLGTVPVSRVVKVSQTSYRTTSDHDAIEAAREAKIALHRTDRARALEAERIADELRSTNRALMDHVMMLERRIEDMTK